MTVTSSLALTQNYVYVPMIRWHSRKSMSLRCKLFPGSLFGRRELRCVLKALRPQLGILEHNGYAPALMRPAKES
jgi:hypothetical protein